MKNNGGINPIIKLSSLVLIVTLLFSAMALSCFAADAEEEFVESTEMLEDLDGSDWIEAVDNAIAKWEAYESVGGTADANPIVEEAYRVFSEQRDLYEACVVFVEKSYDFGSSGFNLYPYETQSRVYEECNAIYQKYKNTNKFILFGGVSTALSKFNAFARVFLEQRDYCEAYVENAALAAAAENYADAKKYIDLAAAAEKNIEIKGYPGIEEADEQISDAKKFISDSMNAAIPFIRAVQKIEDADNQFLAIVNALSAYKSVDSTAAGVASSYKDLMNYVEDYNAMISAANAVVKSVNSSALGLIP